MPDLTSSLREPGLDAWLAQLLLKRGLVEVEALSQLLAEVRKERHQGNTLAQALVERGLLSAEEVERILGELAGLETLAEVGQPPGLASPDLTPTQPKSAGDRVGHGDYVIKEKLGAGGMGVVYRVEHAQTRAHYALKRLPLSADPADKLRFRREGEAQARVDAHPNVVKIHSSGTDGSWLWLVMDLATGGDLQERLSLRRDPPSPRDAATITRDLALGLAHAHAEGVLHRDLKPGNILFDEKGVAKLVDFGLAHVAGAETLTLSGTIMGTPAYMAPEQAMAEARVGPGADIYGLGAVLYRMLTGKPPFAAGSVLLTLQAVLRGEPERPSQLKPGLDPDLETICLKCLEKKPEERYVSASALAEDLDRYLSGDSESRDPKPNRNWVVASLLVCSALLVTIGLALLPGWAHPGVPERGSPSSSSGPEQHPSREQGPATRARPDVPLATWPAQGCTIARFVAGSRILTSYSSSSFFVRLSDLQTGQTLQESRRTSSEEIAVSRDRKRIAFAIGGEVRVVDVRSWSVVNTLRQEGVSDLAFAPDGRSLALGGRDFVRVLALPKGEVLHDFKGTILGNIHLSISADGQHLAAAYSTGAVSFLDVWDLSSATRLHHRPLGNVPACLTSAPRQNAFVLGINSGAVFRLDVATGQASYLRADVTGTRVWLRAAHSEMATDAVFDPRGRLLSVGGNPHSAEPSPIPVFVRVWAEDRELNHRLPRRGGYLAVDVSEDGERVLLLLHTPREVQVWPIQAFLPGG